VIFSPRLNCAELAAALTDYLEAALPRRRVRAFERHLADCADCDNFLRQMKQTIQLTGALAAEDVEQVPPEVRQRLWDAFTASRGPRVGSDDASKDGSQNGSVEDSGK
jgi:anti-sigma factor RsiW